MSVGAYRGKEQLVIGMDVGTTTSTVSYSHLKEGEEPRVQMIMRWPGQPAAAGDCKLPTLVLYDANGTALLFGQIAQTNPDDVENTYLARWFKLWLHPQEMRTHFNLTPPPLPPHVTVKDVYADFLAFLFTHTRTCLEGTIGSGVHDSLWTRFKSDFSLCLAIPNGWDQAQQSVIREAVVKAGILPLEEATSRLSFVTEAEASVHFAVAHADIGSWLRKDSMFLVTDAGGSTVDTVVYRCTEAAPKLMLEEATSSECVQAGGAAVDQAAEQLFRRKLHGTGFDDEDTLETMLSDFKQNAKRKFDGTDGVLVKTGTNFTDKPRNIFRGRLKLPIDDIEQIFAGPLNAIATSIDRAVRRAGRRCDALLTVGGFAESPRLQSYLKDRLTAHNIRLITIDEPTKKAAEGAVYWYAKKFVVARAARKSDRQELESLETQLATARSDVTAMQRQMAVAKAEAEAEVAAVRRQREGDRKEIESLRKKLEAEQLSKRQLSDALANTKTQLVTSRIDVAAMQQQKSQVQEKLQQAKAEIATLRLSRQETEDLRRKLDEENRSKQEMNEALSRAEAQLVASRNEAAALRLFSDEENVDGATVHNHFKDLVTGIDDLVFSVYEKLGEVEVSSPIDIDQNEFGAFAAANPAIANMLRPFLSTIMSTRPTMETVVMPVMHCIASSSLCSYFLQPFYPIAAEFSDLSLYEGLTRLCSGIAERESQEVIGRWRSISYRALRNPQADEDVFFEKWAKYLLNDICNTMVILLPQHLAGSQNWEKLVDALTPRTVKVLRKAVAFQSITQGICITWDYAIYHPTPHETFLEDTMEVDVEVQGDHPKLLEHQPDKGSQLLLTTSLGLQAHRKTVQSQETIVMQKAKVVVLRASKP